MFRVPEQFRMTNGPIPQLNSDPSFGCNGVFIIPWVFGGELRCMVSDGAGWEHVSIRHVSNYVDRIPTWDQMCHIKDLFWEEEDCVVQFHPPKSQYVNNHPAVLHLWRKIGSEFETPPTHLIGIKK